MIKTALAPGKVVGSHYQIVSVLGQGNFGETYIAQDLHAIKRKCVVKRFNFVSNNAAATNKAKELFEREAEVLFALTNPLQNNQIPHFYAYFQHDQDFYLVQELIEGKTLREELQEKTKLTEDEIVDFLEDVLRILTFIHNRGIIHRDIKPENLIRRDRDGKIVLIDFGAVKEIVAQSRYTTLQTRPTLIYTPTYAPQEQRQGSPQFNSDIYALGMTALEALTGWEPERLKDPNTDRVVWSSQIQVSDRLGKIVKKMLDADYKHRYQSASDVLKDIYKLKKTRTLPAKLSSRAIIKQSTLPHAPKSLKYRFLVFAPLLMVFLTLISFFSVRTILRTDSGVDNTTWVTIESESKETGAAPQQSVTNNSNNSNLVPDTSKLQGADSSNKSDRNLGRSDSVLIGPIRFKRGATQKESSSVKIKSEPPPGSNQKNLDSQVPIRFKRAN